MIISSTKARIEPLSYETTYKATGLSQIGNGGVAAPTGLKSQDISFGKRLRDWKTLLGFGLSAAILIFFVLTAHLNLRAIWANIQGANLAYLVLGLIVYFGAFIFRGLRWQLLLRRADLGTGVKMVSLGGLVEIIYLSWFVNCLVPAKLGDAYRAHLLNRRTGADMGRTLGTVVGERIADVLALAALLCVSGVLIAGSLAGAAGNLEVILFLGMGLGMTISAAIVGLRLMSGRVVGWVPARWRGGASRFMEGTLRTFRRDIQIPLYSLTCLVWACEALRMWLVLQSLHVVGLSAGVIIFTALAGSLLSTIPFTPAGLGAVEGASVAILTTFGVASTLAGAVAVLDRVINYWSNIPVGGLLYLVTRKKYASGNNEH